ncbi:guanylate kinase [Desulfospira joergensenii]|uniref:guanylate kinase n=1 Tax=Desulfospira joergensenii TaxID=53329 RepID=UPI0003B4AE1C|nr:guanylate kinase [Desulfospira joergensenii]
MKDKGKLFVVSAPSGAGKTTLVREVLRRFPDLSYSVSHTTRDPRSGEVHGKDYFFVTHQAFTDLVEQGLMLEWAQVHGNCYGTSKSFVEESLEKGLSLILDIDVQGARQIMDSDLKPVSVFIMAPSMEVLRQRLESRGTDSREVIDLRLKNADQEIRQKNIYDHVIVNDRLDRAIDEICALFASEIGGASRIPMENKG